jgi:hypothetical protein
VAVHFNPESVDLAELARKLSDVFKSPPVGAVVGRTRLRDAVIAELGCSELEGEQIVDTMVARGFLAAVSDGGASTRWAIRPHGLER